MAGSLSEQQVLNEVFDATNKVLKTSTTVTSDIEIGAVEIKNSTDDTRATVGANGLHTDVRVIQAGTNIIGKVGIDQTVPGTTNAVVEASASSIKTAVEAKYITAIGHGVTTVTTAGTAVALAAFTACKKVVIQAQTDNTGKIAVGATGVDATVATGTGILLEAGDAFELEIDNLADVFIDSTVNGEGVRYTYFN